MSLCTDHRGVCLELCVVWLQVDVEMMWTLRMIALCVQIQCDTSGHALTQRMQYTDHTEKVFLQPASQKITGEGKQQWKQSTTGLKGPPYKQNVLDDLSSQLLS